MEQDDECSEQDKRTDRQKPAQNSLENRKENGNFVR
jgi:hypothetical protein